MIYEINNLTFSYNEKQRKILNDVSFSINDKELIVVLGKNGSGKSTLFSLMMGLNKEYQGSIMLNGKEITSLKEREIAIVTGYVPQSHDPTFDFKVKDFVLLGCASRIGMFSHPGKDEEQNALDALRKLGIEEFAERNYMELSGGEQQQVVIARALASRPKMLIFDEPTAHLDFANQIKVLRTIKKLNGEGYTIAISTHDPNHALMLNSKVLLLDGKGGLEKGEVEELVNEEKLSKIYNSDIKIRYNEEFKCKICIYTI